MLGHHSFYSTHFLAVWLLSTLILCLSQMISRVKGHSERSSDVGRRLRRIGCYFCYCATANILLEVSFLRQWVGSLNLRALYILAQSLANCGPDASSSAASDP